MMDNLIGDQSQSSRNSSLFDILVNPDKALERHTVEDIENMIDTAIEVLGMIRDGDPTTDDPAAAEIYQELFGS